MFSDSDLWSFTILIVEKTKSNFYYFSLNRNAGVAETQVAAMVMRWPRDRLSSQDSQWCLRTSRVQIPSPALENDALDSLMMVMIIRRTIRFPGN